MKPNIENQINKCSKIQGTFKLKYQFVKENVTKNSTGITFKKLYRESSLTGADHFVIHWNRLKNSEAVWAFLPKLFP